LRLCSRAPRTRMDFSGVAMGRGDDRAARPRPMPRGWAPKSACSCARKRHSALSPSHFASSSFLQPKMRVGIVAPAICPHAHGCRLHHPDSRRDDVCVAVGGHGRWLRSSARRGQVRGCRGQVRRCLGQGCFNSHRLRQPDGHERQLGNAQSQQAPPRTRRLARARKARVFVEAAVISHGVRRPSRISGNSVVMMRSIGFSSLAVWPLIHSEVPPIV